MSTSAMAAGTQTQQQRPKIRQLAQAIRSAAVVLPRRPFPEPGALTSRFQYSVRIDAGDAV